MYVNPLYPFIAQRSDLSNFLTHLTRLGTYDKRTLYTGSSPVRGYAYSKAPTDTAKTALEKILTDQSGPILRARSPFGRFKKMINLPKTFRGGVELDWLRSVCFSETPFSQIHKHYRASGGAHSAAKSNKYEKYGIAFPIDYMIKKSAGPVFYFDSTNSAYQACLDRMVSVGPPAAYKELFPFFEEYGPGNDWRWEREWRFVGDFRFNLDEVSFGLCPENEIPHFEALTSNQVAFIDPDWPVVKAQSHLCQKSLIQTATLLK